LSSKNRSKIIKEILKVIMSNEINNLYEFGGFTFDRKKGKLRQNDNLILLSPKATELLALLLERKGEFVDKEEIFEKIWTDTFVEDGVLTQNIYTLRKVLGNDEDGKTLIENKTRLGYRLTVPVFTADSANKAVETFDTAETKIENPQIPASSHHRAAASVLIIIGLIGLAAIGYRYLRPQITSFFRKPIETVKFTKLTNTGDLTNTVISPDGSLIAFSRDNRVFLKDVNTEKEIKLDIPNAKSLSSLQFSPDGNFLYFRNNKILSTQAEILKVSRFGGEVQSVVERSWGSFSVSPDGRKVAYLLNVPPIAKFNLKVRNLETGEEKEFFVAEQPNSPCLVCSPAWSPDGSKIIFTTNIPPGTGQMFIVDLKNETTEELKFEKLKRFEQVAWFPDGKSFVVSATEGSRFFHLWKVFYPDLETQPITNGLSNYGKVSISGDGKKILAVRADETSNLFVANVENLTEQKQVTFGNQNSFGQNGLHWIDEKKILYSIQTEQNLADNLAILNLEDNSKNIITAETQNSFRMPVSDGRQIWFGMNKAGSAQIFRMDTDGKNIRQLTAGTDGQRQSPRISNDSKYLYYVNRGKDGGKILRFNLQTETEEVVFDNPAFQPGPFLELSPDNKHLTFLRMGNRKDNATDEFNAVMTVVSLENTSDVKVFPVSMIPPIRRFSPDGKFIDYIYAETDGTQIVRQAFDGSTPKPLLTMPADQIFNFAWSKNGKQLVVAKGRRIQDAVLLTDFE
jgi:Tol biopolymer transport system component/DNA-binding winged helix-turn-helix (wHTH) protein